MTDTFLNAISSKKDSAKQLNNLITVKVQEISPLLGV